MTRRDMDPDVTRRDDGPYWAAALVLAIRAGDKERAETAREHLCRLGYRVDVADFQDGKGVRYDR
jgi:hypothetical protein